MVLASRTFLTQVRLQTGSVTPQDTNHCTSSIKIEKKKTVLALNDISGVSDVTKDYLSKEFPRNALDLKKFM